MYKIKNPKIYISGLNPHSGDGGKIGKEELTLICPAIRRLENFGLNVKGPFPGDTLFQKNKVKEYDVAVCMYHDQALIPIKTLDFWNSVNVTLGLPIVRTSPDHGTALNLAGSGDANADSMITAIKLAHKIYKNRLAS